MEKVKMLKIEGYFEIFLLLFLLGLFLLVVKPFIVTILFSASLVFLVYNFHTKLSKKIKSKSISAGFILFIVLFVILLPTYLVLSSIFTGASNLASAYDGEDLSKIDLSNCNLEICQKAQGNIGTLEEYINYGFQSITNFISTSLGGIVSSISDFFINFIIFITSFYFLLVDGDKFTRFLKRVIPLKTEYKSALFLKFRDVTSAVFVDTLLVALVQGILLTIGLYIVSFLGGNISSPLLLGILGTFFALIPMVGTTIIWVPTVIYVLLTGNPFLAIFLAIYCAFIVGLSDNLLRPILLKKKVEVHPFLIFLVIMGGIKVFGFSGIFIGPIIIAFLMSTLHLFKLEFV